MKIFKTAGYLTAIIIVISFWGFKKSTSEVKSKNEFPWLTKFAIFDETVNLSTWTDLPGIGEDSAGVVTINKNYNACTISEYAIKLFDEYKSTGNPELKKTFINQVQWLINPKNYDVFDDTMLVHPYNQPFHDLKAGWYSGLAEAEFICVLIRYYSITNDKSVLPLITKCRNFLLNPEEKKGLKSITPEGNIWIEEYQPSKQERHVITGFYVTMICLDEYCHLMPDDKEAKKILTQCIESAKKSMQFYDNGFGGIAYNRGDKRICNNWYTKMLTIASREVYRISGDEFFKNQYMLWSTYTYNKPVGRAPGTCKIENYNFSQLVIKDTEGFYKAVIDRKMINDENPPNTAPKFCHFVVDFVATDSTAILNFDLHDVKDYIVYYRTAATQEGLKIEKWNQDCMFKTKGKKLQTADKKHFSFLFIYGLKATKSSIGNITFSGS